MGETFSKTYLRPWPEWLPLREAATYARMSSERVKAMVAQGDLVGHRNPQDKRGPKGDGVWWIQRASIDAWHEP